LATGNYGIVRPSDVSPEDVDIILHYTPSRDETTDFTLTKLDSLQYLRPYYSNPNVGGSNEELLGGLYNLTLPAGEFNALGIYTLYFRPKLIRTVINDCGVLSSAPNTKGIILNIQEVPSEDRNKFVNQGLVGYRVEYLNDDNTKIPNFYRIITSCFYCEPVTQNLTNTIQKNVRYRYTNNSTNLLFLTLTPSSSPSNKPNATPYIGVAQQKILITNTFFNPTVVEVEIVEHDASTLAIAIYGNQTKSMEDGVYTIYDSDDNIYRQYNLYEIRDQYNKLLYEVRQDRGDNIDFSKNFANIISENA